MRWISGNEASYYGVIIPCPVIVKSRLAVVLSCRVPIRLGDTAGLRRSAEGIVAIELGGSAGGIAERDNAAQAVGMIVVICNALLHGQRFVNAGAVGVSGSEVVCSVIRQKITYNIFRTF